MTKVLIFDDRRAVRTSLARLLSDVPGVERVDTASSGEELLERYPYERPDLVLIGTQRAVETGVETTRRLVGSHPGAAVVVFGSPDDAAHVAAAVASGARGYLRWDASPAEVALSLLHTSVDAGIPAPRVAPEVPDTVAALTERELQVLRGMSQGKSNSQIGRDLFLSEDTVKTHARRLFRKLGVNDRAQAVACGFRLGLVS